MGDASATPRERFNEGFRRSGYVVGGIAALLAGGIMWLLYPPDFAMDGWLSKGPWERLWRVGAVAFFAFLGGQILVGLAGWVIEGFVFGPPNEEERRADRVGWLALIVAAIAIGGGVAAAKTTGAFLGEDGGVAASTFAALVGGSGGQFIAEHGWLVGWALQLAAGVVGGIAAFVLGIILVYRRFE